MVVYTRIGSVSSGTMRPEDLIPAFMDEIDHIKERMSFDNSIPEMVRVEEASRIDGILGEIERHDDGEEDNGYWESEQVMYDLDTLIDLLNEFSPPYCYFGAHEGDGADYGYWPMMEAVEEAVYDGELIRVDAGDEWPEDEIAERTEAGCFGGIVEVNDHGNVTLYGPDRKEIWSIV